MPVFRNRLPGSVSKQGLELQLATNCLGPYLLTQLLLPILATTASAENSNLVGTVRVVWTASQIVELSAPPQGLIIDEVHNPPKDKGRNYVNSKTGNMFLASEFARRNGTSDGIISVAQNPGAVSTNLFRHTPWLPYIAWPLLHKPELGANTELLSSF
jgi:NAD(P)-dependent dehydrogenase (short-subunit alcohol dehydrogenase family)